MRITRKLLRHTLLLPLLPAFLLTGCSNDSTTAPPPATDGTGVIHGQVDPGSNGFSFTVETAGDPSHPIFGPFEIRGSRIAWDDSLSALTIDLTVTNRGVVSQPEPIGIEFIRLLPESVTVVNPDNDIHGPGAQIDFHFANDDGKWTPGEQSLPRMVAFHVERGRAVAFVAHILIGTSPPGAAIGGLVWNDADRDGFPDPDESGLSGWPVIARSVNAPLMPPDRLWRTTTGPDGLYRFSGLTPGLYEVMSLPGEPNFESTTPITLHVILAASDGGTETFANANFGWREVALPPPLPDSIPVAPGDFTAVSGHWLPDRGGLVANTVTASRCGYVPFADAQQDTANPVCPDTLSMEGPITSIERNRATFSVMGSTIWIGSNPGDSWNGNYEPGDRVRVMVTAPRGLLGLPVLIGIERADGTNAGEETVDGYVTMVFPMPPHAPRKFEAGGVAIIVTPDTEFHFR